LRAVRNVCLKQALSLSVTALSILLTAQWPSAAMAAIVKAVSFHDVNATTRLVLDLDALPKDLSVNDAPGKAMTIAFTGKLKDPAAKPINKNFSWPNLSGVFVDNRNGRVQIFVKRNMLGTVTVKTEANRLVVTIPHFYFRVNDNNEIASGVRYAQFAQKTAAGPVRINVLQIDPKNPGLEIMPALASNRMGSKADVARIVGNNQAIAGINGSFFKPDVGTPLGIMIINQELVSGPIFDRVALGISQNNDLYMAQIHMAGEINLPTGQKILLQNVNQPRVKQTSTVVYTSRWGKSAPAVPTEGVQVLLQNNRVAAVSTTDPLPIPKDGVVVSGPANAELLSLASMSPDRPVSLNVYTVPDWSGMKHAIGGGPWLVRDGRVYVDLLHQNFTSKSLGFREPRSAVGVTSDGKMLLVTVDGRQKNVSVGMTLTELATLMQKLGSVQAMNLDGGSSTQMALFGKTVNNPSSGRVGVSNSLLVRKTNGDNVASQE
jgi:exopolysaccharide biosynthesis protein